MKKFHTKFLKYFSKPLDITNTNVSRCITMVGAQTPMFLPYVKASHVTREFYFIEGIFSGGGGIR